MANNSKIDQMLADPKFRQLMTSSPDRARALVLEARQKDFGKIPKTESFLEKAIKSSRNILGAGIPPLQFMPSNMEELKDIPSVIANQLPIEAGRIGMKIANPISNRLEKFIPKTSEPKTQFGKDISARANQAQMIAAGLELGGAGLNLAKNLKKSFTPFRKFPIEQEILGLEKEAESVSYSGAKAVKKAIPEKFIQAKDSYKAFIDEVDVSETKTTVDDLVSVLDKTIEAKGIRGREFIRPAERNLLSLRDSIASKVKEAVPEIAEEIIDPITNKVSRNIISEASKRVSPKITSIDEVKNFKNQIFKSLSGEHDLEGEFLSHYGDMLESKGLEGLTEVGQQYKKAYQLSKSARAISKGALKRIATAKSSPLEVSDLSSIDKELKTGSIDQASSVAKRLESANNKLQLAIRNQRRAGTIAKVTGFGGTALGILKAISGRKD